MRVIAGAFRGRRLVAPRGDDTRPTSDRVKEAVFSILGDLRGAKVADLYAGSGALGIEALSRGAAEVVFVERARPALRALGQNLQAVGAAERAVVVPTSLARAQEALRARGPFDLIFADPPYAEVAAGLVRELTPLGDLWVPDGVFVLEHASADEPPELGALGLEHEDLRRYGTTSVSFYRRAGENSETRS
ncbi:MAG: 16S rRNA (guanine(966)-N(2))-methyltransferase RsmD [Polyangiaceae bacterium]